MSHRLAALVEAGGTSCSFSFLFFLLYKRRLKGGVDSKDCSVKTFTGKIGFHGK